MAPLRGMLKKKKGSEINWVRLWIEKVMDIDYGCWEI